jgi:hypothetical protein
MLGTRGGGNELVFRNITMLHYRIIHLVFPSPMAPDLKAAAATSQLETDLSSYRTVSRA